MNEPRDDKPSIRATIERLSIAQKSNRGVPLYSRFVNRPTGRVFAAVAFRLGMTPNGVTMVSALFTLTAIAIVATVETTVASGVVVGVFLVIGYALDSADGQLARLRGGGSKLGEWLDHMLDCVKNSALHLAVLIAMYRFFDLDDEALLLLPIAFCLVSATMFFGFIFTDKLVGMHQPALAKNDAAPPSMLRSIVVLPADPGVLCVIMATIGFETAFLWIYGFVFLGYCGHLAARTVKWYRQVGALDAA